MATLPDLAGIYELLGLKVNLRGLDFQDVTARQEMDGSTPVLLVEGDIINLDSESKGLPAVRVTPQIVDRARCLRLELCLCRNSASIRWARCTSRRVLLAPPEASVTVEVRFTDQRQP